MSRRFLVLGILGLCAPSASAQVVINEFNTGTPDFIELRNVLGAPVDVSGWIVSSWYATSGGGLTAEPSFALPKGTVIPANGYLVLQEFGTAGQPGTLPSSISVGFNYFWTDARTIEIALMDDHKAGIDYVYLNWFNNPPAPHLPSGTKWTGSLDKSAGPGDEVRRTGDFDTDDASDWTKSPGNGTPGSKNPGQSDCIALVPYGDPCPSIDGHYPKLHLFGCPSPGNQYLFYLHDGVGGSLAYVVFGFGPGDTPIFGAACTLRVDPVLPFFLKVPLGGAGAGNGSAFLAGWIPPGAEGASLTMQVFAQDGTLAGGFSASTGHTFTVPAPPSH